MRNKTIIGSLITLTLSAVPAAAATNATSADDCIPSPGSDPVYGAWGASGYTEWMLDASAPGDPDGQAGEENLANTVRIGNLEEQWVPGTQDGYSDWADEGNQIPTDTNQAPGSDTDLARYVYVGQESTEVQTGTQQVLNYVQHYSWNGGKRDVSNPPTVVPPHADWQANTKSEPHENGAGHPATWVNDSLHYTANSKGHASWFYLRKVYKEVPVYETVTTYLWQKQLRSFEPGEPGHTEYRWVIEQRTNTPGSDPVVCDVPTDPTDPTDPTKPTKPTKPNEPTKPGTPAEPEAPATFVVHPRKAGVPDDHRSAPVPSSIDAGL